MKALWCHVLTSSFSQSVPFSFSLWEAFWVALWQGLYSLSQYYGQLSQFSLYLGYCTKRHLDIGVKKAFHWDFFSSVRWIEIRVSRSFNCSEKLCLIAEPGSVMKNLCTGGWLTNIWTTLLYGYWNICCVADWNSINNSSG